MQSLRGVEILYTLLSVLATVIKTHIVHLMTDLLLSMFTQYFLVGYNNKRLQEKHFKTPEKLMDGGDYTVTVTSYVLVGGRW